MARILRGVGRPSVHPPQISLKVRRNAPDNRGMGFLHAKTMVAAMVIAFAALVVLAHVVH